MHEMIAINQENITLTYSKFDDVLMPYQKLKKEHQIKEQKTNKIYIMFHMYFIIIFASIFFFNVMHDVKIIVINTFFYIIFNFLMVKINKNITNKIKQEVNKNSMNIQNQLNFLQKVELIFCYFEVKRNPSTYCHCKKIDSLLAKLNNYTVEDGEKTLCKLIQCSWLIKIQNEFSNFSNCYEIFLEIDKILKKEILLKQKQLGKYEYSKEKEMLNYQIKKEDDLLKKLEKSYLEESIVKTINKCSRIKI